MIGYCVYSGIRGRLVLYLCGYRDELRQKLSDATCTALQLANFWQDVSRDLEKAASTFLSISPHSTQSPKTKSSRVSSATATFP